MNLRGIGDRWLSGERIEGVSFYLHDAVTILGGAHDGRSGSVLLLMDVEPEPRYLVRIQGVERELIVRQSSLRA